MKSNAGTLSRKYGYGIVDKDGHPWWSESCVCQDRDPMDDTVDQLNDDPEGDPRCPYRVIELVFREARP